MPILKSLTFTVMPKFSGNPIMNRRIKLITRLEEQKALAQDANYLRPIKRWRTENGEKHLIETRQRVRPWWRTDGTGVTVLAVKYGLKPLEIEKGKPAIAVSSKDKLVGIIDTLINAVRAGELDELLSQQTIARGVPKKRVA